MDLNFLKTKKKFKKGGSNIKPNFYWMCILSVTFVLILVSLAFGLYLFIQTNKEPVSVTTTNTEEKSIRKERFDKVLKYFENRQNKSKEIINNPSPIVDPSL